MSDSALTRRRGLTTIIATMAMAAALLITAPEASQAETPKKNALVGSWLETVTFPTESGRPPRIHDLQWLPFETAFREMESGTDRDGLVRVEITLKAG